ncbi:MAG: hypothetical protein V7L09_29550, partial [Nostoc sp.]
RNKLSKETNHRDAENTERREIERIFASVLGYLFIWKSLSKTTPWYFRTLESWIDEFHAWNYRLLKAIATLKFLP